MGAMRGLKRELGTSVVIAETSRAASSEEVENPKTQNENT